MLTSTASFSCAKVFPADAVDDVIANILDTGSYHQSKQLDAFQVTTLDFAFDLVVTGTTERAHQRCKWDQFPSASIFTLTKLGKKHIGFFVDLLGGLRSPIIDIPLSEPEFHGCRRYLLGCQSQVSLQRTPTSRSPPTKQA
mmetsp:Transcript_8864/g.22459  ORF Transcript_8864/g.22459 Transcript_8864/m.22459 type:complete len:141 (+) Transcript_8864:185-607(+)